MKKMPEKVPRVVGLWLNAHGADFVEMVVNKNTGMTLSELIGSHQKLTKRVKELEEEKDTYQLFEKKIT